jgi:hypothetical protein
MSNLQKIEDVANPEIGKFYLVPCVRADRKRNRKRDFWPIIGPWHEDADIGVAEHHFHYDVRFYTKNEYHSPYSAAELSLGDIQPRNFQTAMHPPAAEFTPLPIVYKRLKMQRQMPEFPRDLAGFIPSLERKFAKVRLKCMTCPHRGMSLKGLPVAADGTVVCNGHGLKWNVRTKKLSMK